MNDRSTTFSVDFSLKHTKTKFYRICTFTGLYFCDNCMSKELFIIPARVIFNWDFKKYGVNVDAASFFKEFRYEPFIDIDVR